MSKWIKLHSRTEWERWEPKKGEAIEGAFVRFLDCVGEYGPFRVAAVQVGERVFKFTAAREVAMFDDAHVKPGERVRIVCDDPGASYKTKSGIARHRSIRAWVDRGAA